jgi:hypothetical protein
MNPDPGSDLKEEDNLYSENDFFDINNIDQLNLNEESKNDNSEQK